MAIPRKSSNASVDKKLQSASWLFLVTLCLCCHGWVHAQSPEAAASPVEGYKDTPLLPGQRWHVHDPERPQPSVVTPGTSSSPEAPGKAPSDAVILFDGRDLAKWSDDHGQPSRWTVEDGAMVSGMGMIETREKFGDVQLHVEFATPATPSGHGQGRGNSGVFLMGKYEFQVLDSYRNPTYPDGQAASLYGQQPPLVNASRPSGEWQVYDIVFTIPRFNQDGKLTVPAYITAFHNGVLVQNHSAYLGPTGHRILAKYTAGDTEFSGPLKLQDHRNPVRFRNIWVRQLPPETKE